MRVAGRKKLSDCVVATGVPHLGRGNHGRYLVQLANVMGEVAGVRRFGAASIDLAYLAAGQLDGYWEEGLAAWDMAAGIVLVREAGGFVYDMDGQSKMLEKGSVMGGNEYIQKALSEVVSRPAPK